MSLLALRSVSKTRGAGGRAVCAMQAISLTIEAGEFVLVEGPSGVGKTTLLAVAGGLLRADSGQVVLAGVELSMLSPAAQRRHRARSVGFVFQRSNLLDGLTARENVLVMAAVAGMPRRDREREADRLLDALAVAALADRSPGTLSGGEEQRVAIARALVHRPSVVLADEPTGNLDSSSGQAVAECLQTVARVQGAGVLVATHDARLAPFATRRLRMLDGRLSEFIA
jgi:putative ABC transport system ATP-binding protein